MPSGATAEVPFAERGGRLRGLLDVACGRYPAFLFGAAVGRILPVFHFHEVRAADLEPALAYLATNKYTTVTSEVIADVVLRGHRPPGRAVALAFDDAWSSLWTVAAPLLRRHGMRAITYAIPARIADASSLRPTIDEGPVDPAQDSGPTPLATWPELRALGSSGVIDVQSHTWSHTMMFSAPRLVDFVSPRFGHEPALNRPRLDADGTLRFLAPDALGTPLYVRRSRMSDGLRFFPDPGAAERCAAHVAANGGPAFFDRPDWRNELTALAGAPAGRTEPETDQRAAILDELTRARTDLESRLGTPVRHICLPWGVAGADTRAMLACAGYETAFANRLTGRFAVAAGDDPFTLKRLHNRHIFALPGLGRRHFLRR